MPGPAFLVEADHYRLVRRVQVRTDNVPDLLDKEWISRELERLLSVRLQRKALQPAVNLGLRDPCSSSQGLGTPVGAAVGGILLLFEKLSATEKAAPIGSVAPG